MLNEENTFKIQHSTFKINKVSETKTISESLEIIQNNQDYTLFSWSKQKGTNPIAVKHAEGIYLYDYDGKRYLDGFDFHAYPYWTAGKPNPTSALAAQRKLKGNLDTRAAMMKRHLQDPGSRLVCMSEFNVSVVTMDLMMRPENASPICSR